MKLGHGQGADESAPAGTRGVRYNADTSVEWSRAAAEAAVRSVTAALRARGGMLGVAATALERHREEAIEVALAALRDAWRAQCRK